MYRKFYELDADPFCLDPDLDFLFLSNAHEEAVSHIAYGLEQEETVILITGDIGTGKTLALHRVIGQLSAAFSPVVIGVTTIDFAQFMRLVMFKLGESDPPHDVSGLLNSFEQKLVQARQAGRKVLLVVDEAQDCDEMLLESIRLLLNLAQPGGQVLQLLLIGQIGLEEKLNRPDLRQFRQRIRVSYRLECLKRDEIEAYVTHRLKVAGRDASLFSRAALDRIFSLSGGIPRLVNQYASRALLAGYVENARTIEPVHVEVDPQDMNGSPEVSMRMGAASVSDLREDVSVSGSQDAPVTRVARDRASTNQDTHADFARHRKHKNRGSWAWLIAIVIAIAAAAATFPKWAPRLGMLGADQSVVGNSASLSPSGAADASRPQVSRDQVATVADTEAVAETDSVIEVAVAQPVAGPDTVTQSSTVVNEVDAAPVDRPTGSAGNGRAAGAALPRSAIDVSSPSAQPSATTLAAAGRIAAPVTRVEEAPTSVHVFSFSTPDRAEASRAKLTSQNLPTFISRELGGGDRTWYRVYLGPFNTRAAAEAVVDSLTKSGAIEYRSFTHKLPTGS